MDTPYTFAMSDGTTSIEDERGVDVTQIRRQLELSVADRVRPMVEAANVLIEIERHAVASKPDRPR